MFENLEKTLEEIRSDLGVYREMFVLFMPILSAKKYVAIFLGVTNTTISNYIDDGRFAEGVHYYYNSNGKEEFIPEGIIKFKQESKNRKHEVKKVEKKINPIASKFLNNRKVVSGG